MANLNAGGKLVAAALFGAGRARRLVEQILELGLDLFEARCINVREVVGDDVEVGLLAGGPFDLMILDMAMPTLGGREALEQIRAQDSAARALALSGTPFDGEDNPRNPATKFDGVLNKPFGNIELLQTVRRILDHQRVTDLRSAVSGSPARSFGAPPEPRARGSVNG
jgi:CheY-like chemotaxis protein